MIGFLKSAACTGDKLAMDSLVSVIVPVYNVEKYVEKAVKSIVHQTYKNIEILLMDDGSTDSSSRICDDMAAEDLRITVYHSDNRGVSVARNKGIEKASGEWLMFVDADDWIDEDAIERLIMASGEEDSDIILGTYFWEFDGTEKRASNKGKRVVVYDIEKYRSEMISACMLGPSETKNLFDESFHNLPKASVPVAKLYRTEVVKKNKLKFNTNLALGEDTLFNCQFYEYAERLVYVNETIYHYVIRSGSAVNSNLERKKSLIIQLLQELEKFVHNKDDKVQTAFRYYTMILLEEYIQNNGMVVCKLGGLRKAKNRICELLETDVVINVRDRFTIDSSVGRREKLMFSLIIKKMTYSALFVCVLYYKLFPNKNRY